MKHVDHAAEVLRTIDAALADQGQQLEAIRMTAEQNGSEISEEQLVFGWLHNAGLDTEPPVRPPAPRYSDSYIVDL